MLLAVLEVSFSRRTGRTGEIKYLYSVQLILLGGYASRGKKTIQGIPEPTPSISSYLTAVLMAQSITLTTG